MYLLGHIRYRAYLAQIQHKPFHTVGVPLLASDKMDPLLLYRPTVLAFEPLHRHLEYYLARPYRHTPESPDSAATLNYMSAFAFGTIKFVFSRSYFKDYPAALVARACALLIPDPEAMIHEAGFHSVPFLAFTIRNASFFYCVSPTHL
jgi:hypothetical protein